MISLVICGGPEKGRVCTVGVEGKQLKPWTSQTSWAEGRPGCWAGHLPGQW